MGGSRRNVARFAKCRRRCNGVPVYAWELFTCSDMNQGISCRSAGRLSASLAEHRAAAGGVHEVELVAAVLRSVEETPIHVCINSSGMPWTVTTNYVDPGHA